MIIEFDKRLLCEKYSGRLDTMKRAGDFVTWEPERVQKCFNFGRGVEKDLTEYMNNNRKYAIFEEVIP